MRMLMIVRLPNDGFNPAVKEGTAGTRTKAILEDLKPEAVYFTEIDGKRTVVAIVDMESPSKTPALAEPWYLTFNAEVELHVVMSEEDLAKAGLEDLGKKWA